jgi:predicted kinase
LPGSGKSTWARRHGVSVLSSDDLRFLLADDESEQTINGAVFASLRYLLRRRLELRRPLTFIDATNLTIRERRAYIGMARLYDCDVEAVFFDISLETCKTRNAMRHRMVPDWVIEAMAARVQPPTVEEGFTTVVTFGD